jgi:hypothetical protein
MDLQTELVAELPGAVNERGVATETGIETSGGLIETKRIADYRGGRIW